MPSIICHFTEMFQLPTDLPHKGCLQTQVLYVSLAGNNLTGWFPQMLSVTYLNMSYNQLSQPKFDTLPPHLQVLYLANNSLSGSIPDNSLTALANLTVLDVASNNLSGSLPNMLPPRLSVLNASHNSFSGRLPDGWKDLHNMTVLKLDHNQFTGECTGSGHCP